MFGFFLDHLIKVRNFFFFFFFPSYTHTPYFIANIDIFRLTPHPPYNHCPPLSTPCLCAHHAQMHPRFRPKHQKLILQCYPAGRGTDKKPNPSELSYLLYYVSTRRAKLTKVGLFLDHKAQSDVYRGRSGNVQVTLDILRALIEKCPEDLNLFANNVVNILTAVVSSNDLALSEYAIPVFDIFCLKQDGVLLRGDPLYIKSFQRLVDLYLEIARGTDSGPNAIQWKLVGIEAMKSIASSVSVSTPSGQSQLEDIIPILLNSLCLDTDGSILKELQRDISNQDSARTGRSSIQLSRSAAANGDNASQKQLLHTAIRALYHFFETTSTDALKKATKTTIDYILTNKSPMQWSETLLEIVTKRALVQTRFAVVTELVEYLVVLSPTDLSRQLTVARLISSLLSSSVNMIGLSVIDVLRMLLHAQLQVLKAVAPSGLKKGTPSAFDLLLTLKECVIALGSHNYYSGQISDMISEILLKCECYQKSSTSNSAVISKLEVNHVGNGSSNNNTTNNNTPNITAALQNAGNSVNTIFLINGLQTISSILSIKGSGPSSLSVITWDGTQHLVNHPSFEVRVAYANAMIQFLDHVGLKLESKVKTLSKFNVLQGPLGELLIELYRLTTTSGNDDQRTENYLIVYHLIYAIIRHSADRGILRACSFALALDRVTNEILTGENVNYTFDQAVAFSSIALSILYHVGATFESMPFFNRVSQDIKTRQEGKVWFTPIDVFTYPENQDKLFLEDLAKVEGAPQLPEYNAENKHLVKAIDESELISVLSAAISEFHPGISLHKDLSLSDGNYPVLRVPTFPMQLTSAADSGNDGSRARSLKQLNNKLLSVRSNSSTKGPGTPKLQDPPLEFTTHITDTNGARVRASSILGSRSVHTIADLRRDFSPRVEDLKRAAESGYQVRIGASPMSSSATSAASADDIKSFKSLKKFDVASFLSSL